MSLGTVSLPFLFAVLVFVLVPRDWKHGPDRRRRLRLRHRAHLLSIDSQIGSNVTRMAMLFAGVVLLAALPYTVPRSRRWYALVLAFAGLNFWIGFKGVDDIVRTTPAASWARELAPLVNQLQQVGAERGRVEVVPASSHREASALRRTSTWPAAGTGRPTWSATRSSTTTPWTRSTTGSGSTAGRCTTWCCPPAGRTAGRSGRRSSCGKGLSYLREIWGDENWQLYRVLEPTPLADPPATVEKAGANELTIRVESAGRVLIRIPHSRWLGLVDEQGKSVERPQETEESKLRTQEDETAPKTFDNIHGCLIKIVDEDPYGDEWTELLAPKPGVYRLAAPYQLQPGTPCPEELS